MAAVVLPLRGPRQAAKGLRRALRGGAQRPFEVWISGPYLFADPRPPQQQVWPVGQFLPCSTLDEIEAAVDAAMVARRRREGRRFT